MTALRPYAAAALFAAACSGPSAPDDPSWADVGPILASNCIRCHGDPGTNGAPDSFRLDVYDDTQLPDGRVIRGAAAMAPFIAVRTNADDAARLGFDLMPPVVHLEDWQVDALCAWGGNHLLLDDQSCQRTAAVGEEPARGDGEPDARVALRRPLEDSLADGGDRLDIHYEITDPDHDVVRGWLTVDGAGDCGDGDRRVGDLHSGRDVLAWDIGAEAPGTRRLGACIDDGSGAGPVEGRVWRYEVTHAAGNTAPSVEVVEPSGHALFHVTRDGSASVSVSVRDPDADAVNLTLRAVHPVHAPDPAPFAIVNDAPRGFVSVALPLAGLTPDRGWRIEASVDNGAGTASRTAISSVAFRVSDGDTSEQFGDAMTGCGDLADGCVGESAPIDCIFTYKCGGCHDASGVPVVLGLDIDLDTAPEPFTRGLIHRRVVELENMPPPSAPAGSTEPLCDSERARLGDWLLGGAPP